MVSPALDKYKQDRLLGEVWKRPGLSARDRSIVTVAALIGRNQPVELADHVKLALDHGVKPAEISEIITHLAFYSGWANAISAIDIAKDWNIALVQDLSGRRRSFKFANRSPDHNEFVHYLDSLSGSVCVGLEPTGDYHRTIAYRLLIEGFHVVSISSLALARFREARFGRMANKGQGILHTCNRPAQPLTAGFRANHKS